MDIGRKENAMNIFDYGTYEHLDWEKLNENQKAELFYMGYEEDMPVCRYDIETFGLNDAVESFAYFEIEDVEHCLRGYLKEADHYLVMAHNCRWNGASGYKITDDIAKTVQRNYDVYIEPISVSKGGKSLICRESSHDVPMGARTTIIALTPREYEKYSDCDWAEIEAFVTQCEEVKHESLV